MSDERRHYIHVALFYNCLTLAMGLAALAVSVWLFITGRLSSEGVDAVFLFAVGLVSGCIFWTVPALSIREGLLNDLRELWREGAKPGFAFEWRPGRVLRESRAH